MVGEFPELQGLMGGYYARAEGLPDAVADAIRDHYKPVGQGDDVPTAPVTVAVALADKLDTLVGFFVEGMEPTGSKDPFALRRQAIAVINLVARNQVSIGLLGALRVIARPIAIQQLQSGANTAADFLAEIAEKAGSLPRDMAQGIVDRAIEDLDPAGLGDRHGQSIVRLVNFFIDRLKVQQREAGVRHDLIDAVFALGGEDDLVRLLARVHALQAFVGTEDGVNLLAGYKRAANILKKEDYAPVEGSYTRESTEQALVDALDAAEPRAEAAVAAEDFTAAMAALATLRAPIDAFFESVTVNDADPAKRAGRLGLLDRFRAAVHKVADFGRIEG